MKNKSLEVNEIKSYKNIITEKQKLTVEQKLILEMSESDILNGRIITH